MSLRLALRPALTCLVVGAAVTVAGTSGGAAAGSSARAGQHSGRHSELITFGERTCAPHWYAPNKGRTRFRIRNNSHHTSTIYLVRLPAGRTVKTLRHSRPGSTRTLRVRLRPGPYLWGCYLAGKPPHVSETEKVPVDNVYGGPGTPVTPLSKTDIAGPYRAYRRYVADGIATLQTKVADLSTAVSGGDLATAKSAWLDARLSWLLLGQNNASYGAFGPLGGRIDGTAAGLAGGTGDPAFTGFHRVELDLWDSGDLSAAATDTTTLETLVGRLAARPTGKWLPASKGAESSWILRVHEVLEDALRDSLSGHDDYGSGTTLSSLTADVAATREDLGLLAPLVKPRSPHLVAATRKRLDHLSHVVSALGSGGSYPALSDLTQAQREKVNAAVSGALEKLALVPALLPIGGHT
ncbi:MAG: EfeM/EfeO family lipoprotein [Nocardioides sp.]